MKRSFLSLLCAFTISTSTFAAVNGWLNWRGPHQNGFSDAKNLPSSLDVKQALWTVNLSGLSTPVIANGKLYIMCYQGEGPELQEGVACFDAETGKPLWQKLYPDFLSDTIYKRYATSSPTIDPETGNVYIQDSQGIFAGFTADGKVLWEHSLMEEFGRLTFPNGRTASPAVDKDLVITRGITANWGAQGPGADRFYAFDKTTGQPVWVSNPGDRPKDNSYSHPVLSWLDGKRVFYSATGDGSVVCVNARTGDPVFRVHLFKAGINSSVLLHGNSIIAIFGTPYEPGQMVCLKIPTPEMLASFKTNAAEPAVVPRAKVELWSNEIRTSASSPILVGDRVYVTGEVGYLVSVDANTGRIMWNLKLGTEQRNSSPLFADGKIYAPILNDPAVNEAGGDEVGGGHGALYVVEPSDTEGKILSKVTLDGRCYGTPTAWNGKVYIQTTKKLYCFGKAGGTDTDLTPAEPAWPAPGPAAQLQVIPNELLMVPGETQDFHIRSIDKNGLPVKDIAANSVKWQTFIPPTAKVRAAMKGSFDSDGKLTADPAMVPSAGAFEAQADGLKGYIRGRVLPGLPIKQDFESFPLSETTSNSVEPPTKFSYPPLPWIGARFKFDVREKDGTKCLVKTVDNIFLRRATVFMGPPSVKNYTIEADVMSEGNKRKMSDVGLINQRYYIRLKGNEQSLEITSNQELLMQRVHFKWTPNTWYRLKARVDVAADGSGIIRAKAWKRDETEPEKWTNELPVKIANPNGCPGLFAFSPQDQRIFIDNISVTSN